MLQPKLHTDSLQIHAKTTIRAHSALLRTLIKAIDELAESGLIVKGTSPGGTVVWVASGDMVIEEFTYTDSVQREQKALRFGSWLCLALTLKVTQGSARQAFVDTLKAHPLR
ncbi:hypothetical protein [Pseudomonas sp. PSPC3-3]|uniref:hypothetical protein n=1 Tax=unclassified Pseudomonas TaxID=196821 RepID=UPI003CF7460A